MDKIGRTSLASEAIRAALQAQRDAAARVDAQASRLFGAELAAPDNSGARTVERTPDQSPGPLVETARRLAAELQGAESLPEDLAAGRITDFHEIATRLKRADLTLKFTLEVRNKLVEAYREVMRMQV